jgi:hypothetical protein
MKTRLIAVMAVLSALLMTPEAVATQQAGVKAPPYEKPRIGGIYGRGVHGPGSYAVLVDVDAIHKGEAKGNATGTANCSNAGAESGNYTYTGWKIAAPRTAHLNPGTVPGYLGGVTTALQASWSAWEVDAAVPHVTLATNGTVAKYTANRLYDVLWGRTGGSLATTYTWQWNDGLIESDTVFNLKYRWWKGPSEGDGCYEGAGNVYDVANIATHEFGHSYGLGHPSSARFETMYAYGYSGETLKRSPASGDRNGVSALY